MKILITILLFCLTSFVYGQNETVKYKQFGDSLFFSELKLMQDKTFKYNHYNMHSCWTWYSVLGNWKIQDSTLELVDSITWDEDAVIFDTTSSDDDNVTIKVQNDKGKPLKNIKVDYHFRYNSSDRFYLTDKNGLIKISKKELAKGKSEFQDNYVQFGIYFSNKRSKEASLSTAFDTIYNKIVITLLDNPKSEIVIRKTLYQIKNDRLFFQKQFYLNNKNFAEMSWGNFVKE